MSGMDRLTEDTLEKWVESLDEKAFWEGPVTFESYQLSELHSIASELLAHRRALQPAPAPSDGLREAAQAALDAWVQDDLDVGQAMHKLDAALSASPAQEGGK